MRTEKGWGNTSIPLPPGAWTNVLSGDKLTGEETKISDLLNTFPVALLVQNSYA